MSDERVVVAIPRPLHDRLKLLAALENKPLSHLMVEAATSGPVGERLDKLPEALRQAANA